MHPEGSRSPTGTTFAGGNGQGDFRPAPGTDRPLGAYAALFATYCASAAGFAFWARRSERFPPRLSPTEVVLSGVATYKASRLLGRAKVMAWLREPFAEQGEPDISTEVSQRPRGDGFRRAVGELLICPYCLSQWIATGIVAGHVAAPRTTRFATTVLGVVAVADFLQPLYRQLQERD